MNLELPKFLVLLPINKWKDYESSIVKIKEKYDLAGKEIHTAFMLRRFIEQDKIQNFEKLSYKERRSEVNQERSKYLISLNSSDLMQEFSLSA